MRGDQACQLCGRGVGSVDDEREEEEREGQVLRFELYDEEAGLAGWVVLCECVCVRHGEGGEEGVVLEADTCEWL